MCTHLWRILQDITNWVGGGGCVYCIWILQELQWRKCEDVLCTLPRSTGFKISLSLIVWRKARRDLLDQEEMKISLELQVEAVKNKLAED
jgi:hypothetical protein